MGVFLLGEIDRGGVEAPEARLLRKWSLPRTASRCVLFTARIIAVERMKKAPRLTSHWFGRNTDILSFIGVGGGGG